MVEQSEEPSKKSLKQRKQRKHMAKKYSILFTVGLVEQLLFTLYLLSVSKYMVGISTFLMFTYFVIYLLIMKYCFDDKNSVKMLFVYAFAAAVGNYIAMVLKIIK